MVWNPRRRNCERYRWRDEHRADLQQLRATDDTRSGARRAGGRNAFRMPESQVRGDHRGDQQQRADYFLPGVRHPVLTLSITSLR